MKKESINEYLLNVSKTISGKKIVKKLFSDIDRFPLGKGQSFYILDYKKKTVLFQKGIFEMLGYSADEFDFELAVNVFHPNDYDLVTRLIRATIMFATQNDVSSDVALFVTYRCKHKNGTFIRVLRQSTVYECDLDGKIISNLSILSDITFLGNSNKVDWKFDAPGLDQKKFKEYVMQAHLDFFSKRELEIIDQLKRGLKSKQIADLLFISKNTVDTHRRKILSKSNCKNTVELLNFCDQSGLL